MWRGLPEKNAVRTLLCLCNPYQMTDKTYSLYNFRHFLTAEIPGSLLNIKDYTRFLYVKRWRLGESIPSSNLKQWVWHLCCSNPGNHELKYDNFGLWKKEMWQTCIKSKWIASMSMSVQSQVRSTQWSNDRIDEIERKVKYARDSEAAEEQDTPRIRKTLAWPALSCYCQPPMWLKNERKTLKKRKTFIRLQCRLNDKMHVFCFRRPEIKTALGTTAARTACKSLLDSEAFNLVKN